MGCKNIGKRKSEFVIRTQNQIQSLGYPKELLKYLIYHDLQSAYEILSMVLSLCYEIKFSNSYIFATWWYTRLIFRLRCNPTSLVI